jgi:hypothetical protein
LSLNHLQRKLKPAPAPEPVEDEETKAESGFSDYNPFQDSPDGEKSSKKRRKVIFLPPQHHFRALC